MRFNLEAGKIRAKVIFAKLDRYIEYYEEATGKKLIDLTLYKKEYNRLESKVFAELKKGDYFGDWTSPGLYYRGIMLKSY